MNPTLLSVIYFFLGAGTWVLAVARVRFTVAEARLCVAGIVLAEELLSIGVIYFLVADKDLINALIFCCGGAVGAYLAFTPKKNSSK